MKLSAAVEVIKNWRAHIAVIAVAIAFATALVWWAFADRHTHRVQAAGGGAADSVTFTDETFARGVLAEHRQGDDRLTGLDETLGSGACALDFDNDGWTDLFIVNGSGDTRYYGRPHWWQRTGGNRLFRNRGGGEFVDVSATALANHPMRGFGCVAVDFDNDGYTDILVTGFDETLLLRNLGNGRFIDVTAQAGLKGHGWQTVAAVADVDGDGLPDLYIGRLVEYQKGGRIYEPGSQYKQDVPGSFNSALYPAQANSLYRNLGGFRFEDVTEQAGVADPDGRTLGAQWIDLDGDDRPDLLVANAAGTGSTVVYHNDGKWRFTALGSETRLQAAAGSRAPTLADLNNDGVPEIVMTATNGAQSAIFFRENSPSSARPLYRDRARPWGFARDDYSGFSPWSAIAADFNNDGWLDVFVGNGIIIPDPDVPRLTVGQPKQLWLNTRDGGLAPQSLAPMDPLADRQSARGAVAADFDNDGDIDLYVTHNNDLGQLLVNQSPYSAHWAGFRLVNTKGNRGAIGARVEIENAGSTQYRWVTSGAGFLSGSDQRVNFGLGSAGAIDRVTVIWPDGRKSKYKDLPVDRYITLTRDAAPGVRPPAAPIESNYASLVHGREPELRADYIRLLVAARGFDKASSELRASLTDADVAVRKASVEVLDAHRSDASLALLLDALADSDSQVVLAAERAVCPYDEEAAARWLLRLFNHSDPAVRSATAECFGRYFYEDKLGAMLHRKYLSVPYLVEALGDSDESVQVAAARALASAERFRGVPPLLELAERTSNATVRAEAIRAVGLIRDKQGTPGLVALLKNPKLKAEPASLASLLIALKRLDYSGLPALMDSLGTARGSFSGMPFRARLSAMREILRSEDGVVLGRGDVAAMARRTYGKIAEFPTDEPTALALIDLLRESNSPQSAPELSWLAANGRTAAVKAASLHALSVIDAARAGKYVEQGLQASDAEVGRRLLESLAGTRVDLSEATLNVALARADTRALVLSVVRRANGTSAADTITRLFADSSTPAPTRAAALGVLTRSQDKISIPAELYATAEPALAAAVVDYEFRRLPTLVVSRTAPPVVDRLLASRSEAVRRATIDALARRPEFWAKGSTLAALKGSRDQALRTHILELIANDVLEGTQILETIANDKADPLRLEAIRHLEGSPGSSAEQLLVGVLRDGSEDPRTRIVAAHRLVGHLGPEVLKLFEQPT